ncbi:hypothetical protein [Methylorubrum extorquens]
MRQFILAGALLYQVLPTSAQESSINNAPFGLHWSATKEEIEKAQITLTPQKGDAFGATFRASGLPKVLADTENVYLSFGYDNKLWRIVATSKTWHNDKNGSQSLDRFNKLSGLLEERYGKGVEISSTPLNKYMQETDKFSYSIYSNDRVQAKNWLTPTASIQLGIRAANMNDLYYLMIYENRKLGDAFSRAKSSKEKDAL